MLASTKHFPCSRLLLRGKIDGGLLNGMSVFAYFLMDKLVDWTFDHGRDRCMVEMVQVMSTPSSYDQLRNHQHRQSKL